MRVNVLSCRLWSTVTLVSLFLLTPAVLRAEDPVEVDASIYADAADALRAGELLENNRQWVEAINHYEATLERFTDDEGLKYGLRRTRIHFGVDRRYSDRSFEEKLLTKGRAEALDLFEDILSRVQYEYVEPVKETRFVAHGTESLYMALKNDRFTAKNKIDDKTEAIDRVRQVLIKDFWNRRIDSRMQARSTITAVCGNCGRNGIHLRRLQCTR